MIGRRHWTAGMAMVMAGASRAAAAGDRWDALSKAFARIEAAHGGRLGVAVLDTANGSEAGRRTRELFPMGSTYKLLAAGAVLARTDAGTDGLDRRLPYTRADVVTYSPITQEHANGDGMTLGALCEASVTLSDNTAGNLLLGILGGPPGLTAFLRSLGDQQSRLDRTEPTVNEAQPGDPRDTTTPEAMLRDIRALALGDALSLPARTTLQGWLRAGKTGGARLRAGLPAGWTVGEKTGTADHGTSNDVGLLWPPSGGQPVLVAAFLTESPANGAGRDAALAAVGAAVADAVAR